MIAERATLKQQLDTSVAALVARAAAQGWPITADHCFLRIAYDNAVGARWDIQHGRPGWRSLPTNALTIAIDILSMIHAAGVPELRRLNAASLAWRRQPRIDGAPVRG